MRKSFYGAMQIVSSTNMTKPTLTKFEVCQSVLSDNARSADDRAKAIAILKRIADDAGDPNCAEARRLLATLPLSQDKEDALLETALAYEHPPLSELRFPQRPLPWAKWSPQLQRLIELLRGVPFMIAPEFYAWSGREDPSPDYAVKWVADLKSLYSRSQSQRVRDAAIKAIRDMSSKLSDDAGRNAAKQFLEEQS